MNLVDYILLGGIIGWAGLVLYRRIWRKKQGLSSGCSGCAGCSSSCRSGSGCGTGGGRR